MRTLVTDLLAYSRVTTQGQPYVPLDLTRIAKEVVSDLEVHIDQVGGRVEVADLPSIEADPTQMRQLLQNLVGNGLKFHRESVTPVVKMRGEVLDGNRHDVVKGSYSGDVCRITVEDNGIGFDDKYLDRIFAIFQRLHGRGRYRGTGVGLAICRKIAERHGGSITAKGALGRGSKFVVVLPVKQPVRE